MFYIIFGFLLFCLCLAIITRFIEYKLMYEQYKQFIRKPRQKSKGSESPVNRMIPMERAQRAYGILKPLLRVLNYGFKDWEDIECLFYNQTDIRCIRDNFMLYPVLWTTEKTHKEKFSDSEVIEYEYRDLTFIEFLEFYKLKPVFC